MTYEIGELAFSVEADPQSGKRLVVLSFEQAGHEFEFRMKPQEATELAVILQSLAAEAGQPASGQRSG